MSRLLIDVGNTRVVVVRQAESRADAPLEAVLEAPTKRDPADPVTLAERVAGLRRSGEAVYVASVVPAVSDALHHELAAAQVVDHTWSLPFATAIKEPRTVGADRWCNVAAAAAAGLTEALIVDAGTATTVDIVSGGVFEGGLIAPGMAFAARALQEAAPRLWTVPFAPCDLKPGTDTAEALQIGAYHVGVHGVIGVVEALLAQRPAAAVVLTGGLGRHLARPGWPYDPDWTLRGLAVLADRRARR